MGEKREYTPVADRGASEVASTGASSPFQDFKLDPMGLGPERPIVLPPEEELVQVRAAIQLLNQELQATRAKLEVTQRQLEMLQTGGGRGGRPISEFKRVIELERLGKQVLEKNAQPNNSLGDIVAFYLAGVERLHEGMMCSCMLVKGKQLFSLAAPSLPPEYMQALDGLSIGPNVGSCGTAAFLGEKVIATDIVQDKRWVEFKHLALPHGLRASWSFPIMRANNHVLGTLAIYYSKAKAPTPEEEASIETTGNLLRLILESKLAEQALRESNERFNLASSATNDAIYDWDVSSNYLFWGPGFERIFGVARTEENTTMAAWEAKVHPEDRQRVVASLVSTLEDATQDHWFMEYRFIKADGSYGYVSERGFIIRNSNQKAVRMVGALQEVTEQKLAEEELRRLSVIAKETINGVMIMNPNLEVQWVNQSFNRIMGFELEEVLGRTPGSFMNGEETDSKTLQYIDDQLFRKQPLECELLQYTKAKRKVWLRIQAQPLLDEQGQIEGMFALLTDITQEKKEEQQLKLLESVITNAHEAITVSRVFPRSQLKPRTIFCNQAYLDLTGYSAEEIIAKPPLMLNGPETDPATLEAADAAIKNQEAHDTELVGYRKSGEKFWAHLSLIPIFNDRHQITHWISMMRDITARKNYEQERELLISELTQSNADLKQYSFIASHNLRAPLSNLKGIVNLIDMSKMPDGQNKLLIQKFKESTLQLNTVIDDLLEVLVIRNGVQVKKERLSLETAFEKVRISVDELLEETEATVEVDFSELPEVEFNPGYLHSILLNLLTNAIKYRSPDRQLYIKVKSGRMNGRPVLHFSDNGLGLDLNRFRDRIFGLYQRFHQHKDSKGMGLYIAQSQAKAMGGQLVIESEVDQGATFTLIFSEEKQ